MKLPQNPEPFSLSADDARLHPGIYYGEFRKRLLPSLPRPIKHFISVGADRKTEAEVVEATIWQSGNDSSRQFGELRREKPKETYSKRLLVKTSERK